ncbi:MAG: hypothetical protein ACE5NN_07635 [Candidatus Bathyarchaeia archaeon]
MEEERLKKIAELRGLLQERVQTLETELEGMRTLLEFVNNLLLEQSFKRVGATGPQPTQPPKPPMQAPRQITQLKAKEGEVLATLYIGEGSMRIVPAGDKRFNVNTPPFIAFLHDRVLSKIRERDQEAAKIGRIPLNRVFKFEIKREGDIISEIVLRNVAPERERELISAIHWTLEKMYDKMKG